jgi:hypothetical protein
MKKKTILNQNKPVHTLESLQKYTFQFTSVFLFQDIQDAFLSHLKKEFNAEPFLFILELKKLSKLTNKKEILNSVKLIVSDFLESNSKNEVNLSGKLLKDLKGKLEIIYKQEEWNGDETPEEIFNPIKKSIYTSMAVDPFPRFIREPSVQEIYLNYIGNDDVMIPLLSGQYVLTDKDFYEPIITEKDIQFLKSMVEDSFDWNLISSESNKQESMNIYISKVNYLPKSIHFEKNMIMKWDYILPYNFFDLYFQTLRDDIDQHITDSKVLDYKNCEEYSKLLQTEVNRTLTKVEASIQLPFPFTHLRKYFYTATSEYDKENEILYFFQKPYIEEKYRKLNFNKDTFPCVGQKSKKKKSQEYQCYMYCSFEIFVFQKISNSKTRYQQIHITVLNEWNLSFMINTVLKARGKEIRKFCHLSQKLEKNLEVLQKEPRGKIVADLLISENKI